MAPAGTHFAASALPALKTAEDCRDYFLTVEPYISSLYDLPQRIVAAGLDRSLLLEVYLSTNPLVSALAFSIFLGPLFLAVSEFNRNYSQVDRCWSILPTLYNAHYVTWSHLNGLPTARLDLLMAVSVFWSVRLTFNYWRKGGYQIGSEDYRWEVLKQYIPPFLFFLFDVVFISILQNLLLFTITTPTYILLLTSQTTPNTLATSDMAFAVLIVSLVITSAIADQQQWNYYTARTTYRSTAKVPQDSPYNAISLDRGFNTHGLWAWSRHPNFAAEQGVWIALFQWSCYATFSFWNWSGIGAVLYLILFQASTWFTELITKRKYEEYAEYQKRVSKFLPKLTTAFTEGMGNEPIGGADKGKGKVENGGLEKRQTRSKTRKA
ncbi:MAG: hypothetical protein M1828_000889 [Chrysothrix sp. TS-e1954]|nr:MAG: hypothetical protein M1828_000889 [Chrysothrix sp. TS-e1954]